MLAGSYFLSGGIEGPLTVTHSHTYMNSWTGSKLIAIIGTSDTPCWLAETCKILLLLLLPIDAPAGLFEANTHGCHMGCKLRLSCSDATGIANAQPGVVVVIAVGCFIC